MKLTEAEVVGDGSTGGLNRMPEVAGRAVGFHLTAAKELGIDISSALEGLQFSERELRRPDFRISWSEYVEVLDRLALSCDTDEAKTRLAAAHSHLASDLQLLASAFVSPSRLYHYFNTVRLPAMYLNIKATQQRVGPNQLRVTIEIPAYCPDSPLFLRGAAFTLEILPEHLSLPRARVSADIGPRLGVYRVTMPEFPAVPGPLPEPVQVRKARAVLETLEGQELSLRRFFDQVGRPPAEAVPLDAGKRLSEAVSGWGLTRREAEVLGCISRGCCNKEIAASLGVSAKTVEVHVTNLLRKGKAGSRTEIMAKLWRVA